MFEHLFKDKQFIEPTDLDAAKILSKTKQWQEREAGLLKCLRAGKKVFYLPEHLAEYFKRSTEIEAAKQAAKKQAKQQAA